MDVQNFSLLDLLHNNRTITEFWKEWAEESNPWREAFVDGDNELEYRIVGIFLGFLTLHAVMLALKAAKVLSEPLASRPTLIANQTHCTLVACLAVYLLFISDGDRNDVAHYRMWQTIGIPVSLAYFAADMCWYCIPKRDGLIMFHHLVMFLCHYPVGSMNGAVLCGAGSAVWAIRLSVCGYLCEVSNPLMNYRWWLLQTLEKHRFDFSVVCVLLVASFIARVVLLGWLLVAVILPRAAEFIEAKQVFIYSMCVLGHTVILLLSLYWLKVLCGGGIKGLLHFKPKPKGSSGFTFGTDMGRKEKPKKA